MFADHVYVPPVELHTYIEPPKEKIIGDILPLVVTGPVPAGTAVVSIPEKKFVLIAGMRPDCGPVN